jgi:cysteine desulfurase
MIYLDNNATTKIEPRVYHKQCEVLNKFYGNPSSLYPAGTSVKELITTARCQLAAFINADIKKGDRILFTSCATESNNSVFFSVLQPSSAGKHIITSLVEHPSILMPATYYETLGCEVTRVGVDHDGILNEKQLISSITPKTVLVSIVFVNSETGVINDVARITKAVKSINDNILVHTDAVQAAGKIPIDVEKLGVDFVTLSGHKFHAPKGVGILYIKAGVPYSPFLLGGHQEFNLRSGTENTASIIAMGEAARIAQEKLNSGVSNAIEALRNSMETRLQSTFYDSIVFGKDAPRVGNTTNIGFKGIIGDKLVLQLAQREICVSSGTACNSESAEPSGTLRAMQAPEDHIRSIRISLCRETTESDTSALISALEQIIHN